MSLLSTHSQTGSSVLLHLTRCINCVCAPVQECVCECVGVCVQQAGQYRSRGRISCYRLGKTVLQYRNVLCAMLFFYTHTHTHNKKSVYEAVVVQRCMMVCVCVCRRCVFTCVLLTLTEVSWHSRHSWAVLKARTLILVMRDCTPCLASWRSKECVCVCVTCVSAEINHITLMKKLSMILHDLFVWNNLNVSLLPLEGAPLLCTYTLMSEWQIDECEIYTPSLPWCVSCVCVFFWKKKVERAKRKILRSEDIF